VRKHKRFHQRFQKYSREGSPKSSRIEREEFEMNSHEILCCESEGGGSAKASAAFRMPDAPEKEN